MTTSAVSKVTLGDAKVASVTVGSCERLVLVAGPCVIENRDICFRVAEHLKRLTSELRIALVFKASFDKANRTSGSSFRGLGIQRGLDVLDQVRREFSVPVVSDVHLPEQAAICAEVLDVLQIPAFLARQTDLVEAVAKTQNCVQVKKAQFMAPWDMKSVIDKIKAQGNDRIILVERGSSFGYNRLICDMTAIEQMRRLGYPVLIDATHATQQPGGLGDVSGGSAEMAKVLARAGVAAGADGVFIETHPNPAEALSDAACMIRLDELAPVLAACRDIYDCVRRN